MNPSDMDYRQPPETVILSEAKNLKSGKVEILRFAQNDKRRVSEVAYITGGQELLDDISDLWELQRLHHCEKSKYFKADFENITFAERKAALLAKDGEMFIVIARERDENVGYCVSISAKEKGSIESLFVLPKYRKTGIARKLMETTLNRLGACNKITLEVSVGNENVLPFYQKLGFYPKEILLIHKEEFV